ncbi:MAG: transglycosylase SLT domain-containing protein [Elusimicrobia bacterium]|nr:transglycosylase SLT domain-containing protein [Elusimicrobiota bacterium]
MEFDPSLHKAFCILAAEEEWAWAAAVVEQESAWNALAVSDSNLALGLFQMHPNFVADMFREYGGDAHMLIALHHSPFAQAEAFKRFWRRRFADLSVNDRLGLYHYHGTNLAAWEAQARSEDPDPDGYIERVRAHYQRITAPAKKAA